MDVERGGGLVLVLVAGRWGRKRPNVDDHPIRLAKSIRCAVSIYDTLDILLKFFVAGSEAGCRDNCT